MTHLPASRHADEGRLGDSLERHLDAARAQSQCGPADIVWVRIDAPVARPEAVMQQFPEHDLLLWSPPQGPSFAGIGVARSISGKGARRFAELRRRGAELWSELRAPGIARGALEAPRLFGGFAFSAEREHGPAWERFGSARMVLPRVTYATDQGRAVLTLAVERAELDRGLESEHVRLLQRVYETVLENPDFLTVPEPRALTRTEPDAGEFRRRVDDLVGAIASGSLQKVVAAREVQLGFAGPLDALGTVSALAEQAQECQRFLFRWGDSSFIGATPERLLRKRGRALETAAVAGSIDAGAESPERQLEANAKELEEHQLVVSAIQSVLDPVCEEMRLPNRPGVQRLKHLLHLCTPIQATLRSELHVLELLERLHPTPAVGGVPTSAALDWILRQEPFDRGWYAGGVGWFDAFGDGDFNVALRSGLLQGSQARLYAGAGIVRGSVAAAEYAETTLKLAAMLGSIRARP